jgi:hypothetical protein
MDSELQFSRLQLHIAGKRFPFWLITVNTKHTHIMIWAVNEVKTMVKYPCPWSWKFLKIQWEIITYQVSDKTAVIWLGRKGWWHYIGCAPSEATQSSSNLFGKWPVVFVNGSHSLVKLVLISQLVHSYSDPEICLELHAVSQEGLLPAISSL